MIVSIIKKEVQSALDTLGYSCRNWTLEHPVDVSHGDYATNVALILGKQLDRNPKEIAEELFRLIETIKPESVEKIEIAGPGFINFYLTRDFFTESIGTILDERDTYGTSTILLGKKMMVEYTDPNVMKPFHIGHVMSNAIGESLARIYEWSGAEVKRANYFSDVGLNIAKAVWGMRALAREMPNNDASVTERTDFLGKAYVYGVTESDAHPETAEKIKEINKTLYDRSDTELVKLYDVGRQWSIEHFEKLYVVLGSTFDYFYPESTIADEAKKIVRDALAKGIFEKSDGAIVFRGDQHGLHTRVFINAQGIPTYEAKELALNTQKQRDYPFDESIIITANEQNEYFKVVLKVLDHIDPHLCAKMKHISHGMMTLTTGKMSSRKGNAITGESLIQDMTEASRLIMAERIDALGDNGQDIAEMIAIGAIKYSILKQGIGKNIIFDPNMSLSFEGDSGPYIQYTAVRTKALLEKGEKENVLPSIEKPLPEATRLEKLLYRFPEVVETALREYAPHEIAQYVTHVAGVFNSFYAQEKIVDESDTYSAYKLAITKATRIIITNSLWILGIRVPERM